MDLKQIEKLMSAMNRQGMKRLHIKQEGIEIELERECAFVPHQASAEFGQHPPLRTLPVVTQPLADKVEAITEVKEAKYITSPMVGTFYAAPSPEDAPYVKVGDRVEEGSIVCIIEAMKVMNEVKGSLSGVVAEVLLRNGDPVEFGTKILRIT